MHFFYCIIRDKSNTTVATTSNKKPTIANIEKKESIKDSDEWENF